MRPIKFRAWDVENKAMIPWSNKFFSDSSAVTGYGDDFPEDDKHIVLMQWTGLHDVDGAEIYEDDLVRITIEASDFNRKHFGILKPQQELALIKWDDDSACFIERFRPSQKMWPIFEHMRLCDSDAVVIGNIYEHPHLLESKEDL